MAKRMASYINPKLLKKYDTGPPKQKGGLSLGEKTGEIREKKLMNDLHVLGISTVRQYPWGKCLEPRRKFVSDLAIPELKILIEVLGGAHIAGKKKLFADIERSRLATQNGFIILPYSTEEVDSEFAPLDIQRYLQEHHGY